MQKHLKTEQRIQEKNNCLKWYVKLALKELVVIPMEKEIGRH